MCLYIQGESIYRVCMYFIQYTQRGIIKSDYHFVSETSFRKFMIISINKKFILPSCVITMDVAYWRIPVTMIEIYRKIIIY